MVRSTQEGRHRFYQVDGSSILRNLDALSEQCRELMKKCGC
jgi:hypothetical protein